MSFCKFRRATEWDAEEIETETETENEPEQEKAKTPEYLALSALWRRQKVYCFFCMFFAQSLRLTDR